MNHAKFRHNLVCTSIIVSCYMRIKFNNKCLCFIGISSCTTSFIDLANLCKYLLIRRTEGIVRNFTRRDPPDVVMLQLLRNAFGNGGIEQCQMHSDVWIFVDNIHKHIADRESDGKLLPAFPDERLLFRFAGFHLTADKLPKESSCLVRRALADHKLFALPDESRYYFGHKNRLISLLVLFQNGIKKCCAALINIPIRHIKALGIPRIGNITAAVGEIHQLVYGTHLNIFAYGNFNIYPFSFRYSLCRAFGNFRALYVHPYSKV